MSEAIKAVTERIMKFYGNQVRNIVREEIAKAFDELAQESIFSLADESPKSKSEEFGRMSNTDREAAKRFALAIIMRDLVGLSDFGIELRGLDDKRYEYQDKFAEEVIYRMAYLGEPDF